MAYSPPSLHTLIGTPALHCDACQAPNGRSAARIISSVQDVRWHDNGAVDGKTAETCSPDLMAFLQNKDFCGVRPPSTHPLLAYDASGA